MIGRRRENRGTREGDIVSGLVVCGDSPLAYRLAAALSDRPGVNVTVILPSRNHNHGPRICALAGVRVIEAPLPDHDTLRAAGIEGSEALALVDQDDVGNINTALRARELNPSLRLVLRFFNMSLGYRIRELFPGSVVLSDSATAAPLFVAAALGEVPANYTRLPGRSHRSVYVAERAKVAPEQVLLGLVDSDAPAGRQRLPEDPDTADLVLAEASGPIHTGDEPAARPVAAIRLLRALNPVGAPAKARWAQLGSVLSRKLTLAALALLGLLALGVVLLVWFARYSWADALYLVVLDAAGAADPDTRLGGFEKVIQAVITLVGITFIPVVTAAVVDAIIKARLSTALGRPPPLRDHIVVIGLGNIGAQVVHRLYDLGIPMVGIEQDEQAGGVRVARRLGVPVLIGDGSRERVLRQAHVAHSRALMAVTNDDMTNLEAALHGRAMRARLRVVLRLFDDELAEQVERYFEITISRSVSFLSAPAFTAAMAGRQILATIPIGRRVLLIAEIPVNDRANLVGLPLQDIDDAHMYRVLALQRRGNEELDLPAPTEHSLEVGDRLVVVATRTGLARLISWSMPAPPPHPDFKGITVP